jgi:hypothetical protein
MLEFTQIFRNTSIAGNVSDEKIHERYFNSLSTTTRVPSCQIRMPFLGHGALLYFFGGKCGEMRFPIV